MLDSRFHIIGLGIGAPAELSVSSKTALSDCDTVIGSKRQFELLEKRLGKNQEFIELPKLSELPGTLDSLAGQNIAVLASGDPLYFGIGRWFSQHFDHDRLSFYPAVSSIQMACHRLGLSLQDTRVVSLHGRPLTGIRRYLKRNQPLIILTDNNSNPRALARECIKAGFPGSLLTVCENLGYAEEKIRAVEANSLIADNDYEFSALNICVIQPVGEGNVNPEFPGFDDRLFITDGEPGQGMISKREVRLNILSLLQPANDDVIWDLGAGCGGVSTELAYWNDRVVVYAVEQHKQRLQCLKANREKFGVTANLHILEGRVPAALAGLPAANKVFIGGSDGELEQLLKQLWLDLPDRGLLVASAVTEASANLLEQFALTLEAIQIETVQLAVSRGEQSDQSIRYQTKRPVILFKFTKSGQSQ